VKVCLWLQKCFEYDFEYVLFLWTYLWIEYEYEFGWLHFEPDLMGYTLTLIDIFI
jgi:hypothetical protein